MPPRRKSARQKTPAAWPFNGVHRGVYIADNLELLRSLNDECVDLVCIDPPFDKNETFTAETLKPPLSEPERLNELRLLAQWGIETPEQAAAAELEWPADHKIKGGYKDIWRWDADIHEDWVKTLEIHYPAINSLIETTRMIHSDGRAAYLCFMAIRLVEIRRILKPTGSLYLHCDHAANGYLRQLLDAVFGKDNMRREIVWDIAVLSGYKTATNNWIRGHDTIFYYVKSPKAVFNRQVQPHRKEYIDRFNKVDENGEKYFDGRGKRRYLKDVLEKGKAVGDVWSDIMSFQQTPTAKERIGYPTQKPVALAERIISASTNPGDVVLDCFAGCACAAIAAERLGRRWLACDMNIRAWTVFKRQFNKPQLATLTCNDETVGQQVMTGEYAQVFGPHHLPQRESPDLPTTLAPLPIAERKYRQPRQKPVMTEDEMLRELLEFSNYTAWCCGFANRKPNGEVIRQTWNFHLDHIDPVSAGGINEIFNRAPMCPYHNIRKSNQLVALRQYRHQIAAANELQVDNILQLADLGEAQRYANRIYAKYERERRPPREPGV